MIFHRYEGDSSSFTFRKHFERFADRKMIEKKKKKESTSFLIDIVKRKRYPLLSMRLRTKIKFDLKREI